jgi:hypothetical protein
LARRFLELISWIDLQHCQYLMLGCLGTTSSYTENYDTRSERNSL